MKISILDNVLTTIGLETESVGIAFSGGGARGFSHVGVILALEKFGITPRIISGASAGAIAAALYGAGLNAKEILECFADYSKFTSFTEWSIPTEGILKLNKFEKILSGWLPVRNLEEMKIPTVICATDIDSGKSVGFTKGAIAKRVAASCSIPVIFQPVKINGVNYYDGLLPRNLPAWAIREHCKTLIGSNCSPLDRDYSYKKSLLSIATRTFQLMAKSNVINDIKLCDYVIQNPQLSKYSTFNISDSDDIVRRGYDAACRTLETAFKSRK